MGKGTTQPRFGRSLVFLTAGDLEVRFLKVNSFGVEVTPNGIVRTPH